MSKSITPATSSDKARGKKGALESAHKEGQVIQFMSSNYQSTPTCDRIHPRQQIFSTSTTDSHGRQLACRFQTQIEGLKWNVVWAPQRTHPRAVTQLHISHSIQLDAPADQGKFLADYYDRHLPESFQNVKWQSNDSSNIGWPADIWTVNGQL